MSANPALIPSVVDVDALRKLWPGDNTDLVSIWLQGVSAYNDSAGMYTWDATSSEPDDNSIVINPTGNSGNGRWLSNSAQSGASSLTPQDFGAFADGTAHFLTTQDIADNPQWVKKYDGSSWTTADTWDSVAFQQCVYACFASTSPAGGSPVWNHLLTNGSILYNRVMFIPKGQYYINSTMQICARGFEINSEAKSVCQLQWYGPQATPLGMIFTDSVSYGVFRNLTLTAESLIDGPLLSLDHTGAIAGLSPQQLTFYDPVLFGNLKATKGIDIAPTGSSAQGDTITFVNSYAQQFIEYAYGLYGANAICNVFLGGDIQFCSKYGIYGAAGQVGIFGMHTENQFYYLNFTPAYSQIVTDGADVFSSAPTGNPSSIASLRSEAEVGFKGGGAPNIASNLYNLSVSCVDFFTEYPYPTGQTVKGGNVTSPTNFKTFMAVADGGSANTAEWYKPTAVVGTLITVASASWTPGALVGQNLFYRFSNGYASHLTITANTATTLTVDVDPGGFTAGTTMIRVSGRTAATPPDFNTCPPGYSVTPGSVGQGFTTVAGSTTVTVGSAILLTIVVGSYVVICNGNKLGPNVAGIRDWRTAHIARVTAVGATTITLDYAPAFSMTDANGYWGQHIQSGDYRFIEIDFDTVTNCASLTSCGSSYGRLRNVTNIVGGYTSNIENPSRYCYTWNPNIVGATSGAAGITSQTGWFELVGLQTVICHGQIVTSSMGTCVGAPCISLPFPVASDSAATGGGSINLATGMTHQAGYTQWTLYPRGDFQYAFIREQGSGVADSPQLLANMAAATTINFTCVYRRALA